LAGKNGLNPVCGRRLALYSDPIWIGSKSERIDGTIRARTFPDKLIRSTHTLQAEKPNCFHRWTALSVAVRKEKTLSVVSLLAYEFIALALIRLVKAAYTFDAFGPDGLFWCHGEISFNEKMARLRLQEGKGKRKEDCISPPGLAAA
jgi:hypothetical protein